MKSNVIAQKWKKNRFEFYRVAFDEYKGRPHLSLRIWYEDDAGELKAGKVGINFGMDHFERVFGAMRRIERKLKKRGMLPSKPAKRKPFR